MLSRRAFIAGEIGKFPGFLGGRPVLQVARNTTRSARWPLPLEAV